MMLVRKAPVLTLLLVSSLAHADDGYLTYGGSPRLLSNHPTIRMVRERVAIDVRAKGYHVDATFVFRNEGAATSVRMGFPDQGGGAEETVYGEDVADAKEKGRPPKPYAGLKGFRSWVDGKPTSTVLLAEGKDESVASWHAKTVVFGRGKTRIVRVVYDADGGGATNSGKYLRQAAYVLHTGASWRGPIGRAEVVVRFAPGVLKGAIRPFSLKDLAQWRRGTVFWQGPSKPTARGWELRFVRSRFEPTENDDIGLFFGYGSAIGT